MNQNPFEALHVFRVNVLNAFRAAWFLGTDDWESDAVKQLATERNKRAIECLCELKENCRWSDELFRLTNAARAEARRLAPMMAANEIEAITPQLERLVCDLVTFTPSGHSSAREQAAKLYKKYDPINTEIGRKIATMGLDWKALTRPQESELDPREWTLPRLGKELGFCESVKVLNGIITKNGITLHERKQGKKVGLFQITVSDFQKLQEAIKNYRPRIKK